MGTGAGGQTGKPMFFSLFSSVFLSGGLTEAEGRERP